MALLSEISERYGAQGSNVKKYIIVGDTVRQVNKSSTFRFLKFLREAFLPQGYPDSVSEDYLQYQIWDTLQAFSSYITGTLATQAVLKGVGVGDSTASPIAATITWILKDGLGMLGRIVFAWVKGTDLDCNAKKWRLVADILNDVALCLELLAGLIPGLFVAIICVASLTKAIVGVAGGATRAALVQHQAKRDNMADVSAKDGSQETLVNLLGMMIGLVLVPIVSGNTRKYKLNLACSLESVLSDALDYKSAYNKHIRYSAKSIINVSSEKNEVNISYQCGSTVEDELMGAVTGEIFENIVSRKDVLNGGVLSRYEAQISRLEKNEDFLEMSEKLCREVFATLLSQCSEVGWNTSHHLLGLQEWRYKWD